LRSVVGCTYGYYDYSNYTTNSCLKWNQTSNGGVKNGKNYRGRLKWEVNKRDQA